MNVHLTAPDPLDVEPVHYVHARTADGLDAAEIRLRFDKATGPARALALLARVAIEVVVHARNVRPVECGTREQEGSRWNGA